ncbi:MAG: hypothetical protein RLY93_07935 [Sumerlaeia bacterium]
MNVVATMVADGIATTEEKVVLDAVRRRVGMSEEELNELLRDPSQVRFLVPASEKEKIQQLTDIVFMIVADQRVKDVEVMLATSVAIKFGISPSIVLDMIRRLQRAQSLYTGEEE